MTHTTKHTPGPWVVSDDGDITLIIHAPKDEVDIARMSNDCEMFSEIRANAHLIAAAPAMYAALSDVPLPSCNGDKAEWYARFYAWYCGAGQAAIAQAEGHQHG